MYRPILVIFGATALTAMAAPETVYAQSFDCAKASTAVEKQICNDPDLGLMDTELGSVYGALRKSLSGDARSALRDSQRAWMRQRNACDAQSDCVTEAYVQRLRELDRDYDVFAGWSGDFTSWADLQLSPTDQGGGAYAVSVSGAGQNWTCDGTLSAALSDDGTALVVSHRGDSVRVQAAGTGLSVPAALDAVIASNGLCGASAPSFAGFFARTAHAQRAQPGFEGAPFVHPQIIEALSTSLADSGDTVVAINLTDAQDSNSLGGAFKVEPATAGGAWPTVSMTGNNESFSYQLIGTTAQGVHVLKTSEWGGGSGVFNNLMLVSYRRGQGIEVDWAAKAIQPGEARLVLFKHGEIVLGDRWAGTLKVDGDRLFIGANESGRPDAGEAQSGWLTFEAADPPAQ